MFYNVTQLSLSYKTPVGAGVGLPGASGRYAHVQRVHMRRGLWSEEGPGGAWRGLWGGRLESVPERLVRDMPMYFCKQKSKLPTAVQQN